MSRLLRRHDRHSRPGIFGFTVLLALMLFGCSMPSAPTPLIAPSAPTPTPSPTPPPVAQQAPKVVRCASGRLRVGDLPAVGDEWVAGVQTAIQTASSWRPDAQLVIVQVGCEPLEPAFRWNGTFYSRTAQSFFYSDTGMSDPAEIDPDSVPVLPLDQVDFRQLHVALARAGYSDDAELDPAGGVTIRLNSATDAFGPPGTPPGLVYHVSVVGLGTVQDLFVSSPGWTIHSYQDRD